MNKKKFVLPAVGLILWLIAGPAAAYDVEELSVEILPDGSATVRAGYSLNWGEFIAYNLMFNREQLAEEAIENALDEDVEVNYITGDEASVTIPSFAMVTGSEGNISYTTPKLPYDKIDDYSGKIDIPLLKNFVADADSLTPDTTVIKFPDGYNVSYSKPYAGGFVPSLTH
jgi:hypothetical protein